MRTAYWDSGDPEMYFDNPNLRWGSPAYLLEPGDPGYVDPSPSVNITKTKKIRMKHNNYYPYKQSEQVIWLANYSSKLPGYATALNLTTNEMTGRLADCGWAMYVLEKWLPEARTWTQSGTDALAEMQNGTGTDPQDLPVFNPPALPTGVVAVPPGALTRIFAQVTAIKEGSRLTDAIATDLRISGSEAARPDLTTLQPVISAKVTGGAVEIKWGWQGLSAWLDSCEIQVDRGDGKGFGLLTIDTTPNYTDTQPFPSAKSVWTYKATYRVGDKPVGLWSQTTSVAVPA